MNTTRIPKILILESQMIIAADISLQLSKLGYHVIGIINQLENALGIIEKKRPDIVFMNIEMQGRAVGLKFARMILEVLQIPVVFLSSIYNQEFLKEIIAAQPYAFISKPFGKKDLKRGIETTLERMAAEGLWSKLFRINAING